MYKTTSTPPRVKRHDQHLRLSDEEMADIREAAEREGFQSPGAFMRHYSLRAARAGKYPTHANPLSGGITIPWGPQVETK